MTKLSSVPDRAEAIWHDQIIAIAKKYVQLAKPGIVMGNLISGIGGFLLAARGHVDLGLFLATMAGISLVVASGCAFNNVIDRDIDSKMQRTQKRALVQGSVAPVSVLIYAALLVIAGTALLYAAANLLSVILVLTGLFIYVGLYSLYLKRQSVYGTLIGSLSGAMPPVVGYCAVTGRFDLGAALLLLTFSLWQMPHSYAIAIVYLKDYAAAGIPVLPVKLGVPTAKKRILLYIPFYTAAALMLGLCGYVGFLYLIVTAAIGIYWLYVGLKGYRTTDDRAWARKMFGVSIIAVIALSIMMAVDYRPSPLVLCPFLDLL